MSTVLAVYHYYHHHNNSNNITVICLKQVTRFSHLTQTL